MPISSATKRLVQTIATGIVKSFEGKIAMTTPAVQPPMRTTLFKREIQKCGPPGTFISTLSFIHLRAKAVQKVGQKRVVRVIENTLEGVNDVVKTSHRSDGKNENTADCGRLCLGWSGRKIQLHLHRSCGRNLDRGLPCMEVAGVSAGREVMSPAHLLEVPGVFAGLLLPLEDHVLVVEVVPVEPVRIGAGPAETVLGHNDLLESGVRIAGDLEIVGETIDHVAEGRFRLVNASHDVFYLCCE